MTILTTTRPLRAAMLLLAAMVMGCASAQKPAALTQAESMYNQLVAANARSRVEADMIKATEALNQAQIASSGHQNAAYVDGLSQIALRTTQTAEAHDRTILAQRAADSLRTARLNRLLTLSESQRASLMSQQQLSQQEIDALRQRNMLVSQQADSLRVRADSLRRANEAANARLDSALMQLRSLVTEITNLKETSRGLVISLSDILFDVNKATLKSGAAQNVGRIATILKQYPDKQISVEGHTDATGGDAYNQKLSEDRAASVREALVAGGVNASVITSRGFGKTQPVATNATPEGRQQNRRVEIVVLGAGSMAAAAAQQTPGAASDTTQKPPR